MFNNFLKPQQTLDPNSERLLSEHQIQNDIAAHNSLMQNRIPETSLQFQDKMMNPAASEALGIEDIIRDINLADLNPTELKRLYDLYILIKNIETIVKDAHIADRRMQNPDWVCPADFKVDDPALKYFRSQFFVYLTMTRAKNGRDRQLYATSRAEIMREAPRQYKE